MTCHHVHVRTQPSPAEWMDNGRQWATDQGLPPYAAVWFGWHLILCTPKESTDG